MHFAGDALRLVARHDDAGPGAGFVALAVLHFDLPVLHHGGVGYLCPRHTHAADDGAVALLHQFCGAAGNGERTHTGHMPRCWQVGIAGEALRQKPCIHLGDAGAGFLECELDRAVHVPGAAQNHEGLGRPAVAAQGQVNRIKQFQRVGAQF